MARAGKTWSGCATQPGGETRLCELGQFFFPRALITAASIFWSASSGKEDKSPQWGTRCGSVPSRSNTKIQYLPSSSEHVVPEENGAASASGNPRLTASHKPVFQQRSSLVAYLNLECAVCQIHSGLAHFTKHAEVCPVHSSLLEESNRRDTTPCQHHQPPPLTFRCITSMKHGCYHWHTIELSICQQRRVTDTMWFNGKVHKTFCTQDNIFIAAIMKATLPDYVTIQALTIASKSRKYVHTASRTSAPGKIKIAINSTCSSQDIGLIPLPSFTTKLEVVTFLAPDVMSFSKLHVFFHGLPTNIPTCWGKTSLASQHVPAIPSTLT